LAAELKSAVVAVRDKLCYVVIFQYFRNSNPFQPRIILSVTHPLDADPTSHVEG
jgi:hypothetical protein